jgi:AcrR family transcriptional regulator
MSIRVPAPSETDTRTSILIATVEALRSRRPDELNLNEVCSTLGIRPSLIQYHFGSRNGLITEAAVSAYEFYVEGLAARVEAAAPDPESRLKAWITGQADWVVEYPGVASLLNFGLFIMGFDDEGTAAQKARFDAAGVSNMALVGRLVLDVRRGRVTAAEVEIGDFGADDLELGTITTWFTLGMSTWLGGRHIPTRRIADHVELTGLRDRTVDRLINLVADRV